jgi:hypothetical protein
MFSREKVRDEFLKNGMKISSAKSYSSALGIIYKKMGGDDVLNTPFSKFFNLEHFDDVFGHLKPNTRRNYISAVIAYMKMRGDVENPIFEELSQERDDLHGIYTRIVENGEKTRNEEILWVEADNLQKAFSEKIRPVLNRLGFDGSSKKSPPKKSEFEDKEIDKIRDLIITAVYLYPFSSFKENFGVMRNDFGNMKYFPYKTKKGAKIKYPNEKDNFFVSKPGGSGFLYMNDYKTSSSYGPSEIVLPNYLSNLLKKWAQFMALVSEDDLFPKVSKNQITHILQRTLKKYTGKPLSTQMLRKIYVSSRFGKDKKNREEVAKSMQHSVGIQGSNYTKE